MLRNEMLQKLNNTKFCVLWPDYSWDDLGFTEHQIWINSMGFGYFACEEPNVFYKAVRISDEKWKAIRSKLENGELAFEDIQETSLSEMYFCEDEDDFTCEKLQNLLSLPEILGEFFFCGETIDDPYPLFFSSEKEFLEFFERDWCDTKWTELNDEELSTWIERLHNDNVDLSFPYELIDRGIG